MDDLRTGATDPLGREQPFGFDVSLEVFDRVSRLAANLFTAAHASIILMNEGVFWRSQYQDALPADDPICERVMAEGELFWVEDGPKDPRVADHPLVTAEPHLRFNASCPIRLSDGRVPGVLSVSSRTPQAFDPVKAALLEDLAGFLAEEWFRAAAAQALARSEMERDAALDRHRRAEERLNLALTLADVHVWELDYGRRELISAGAEDTFFDITRTYDDLCRDLYATVDARDRAHVEEAWRRHLETGARFRPVYRTARSDGQEVWAQCAVKVVPVPGGAARVIGAMQNITDRKHVEMALVQAKEDAEKANRAKSTFLAMISHEIRTPLNGVLGMAQAMAASKLTDQQRERLNVIRQSGETLLAILNDVLDLSKIEAGKFELEETEFDLGELVQGACAPFLAVAEGKGVHFEVEMQDEARGVYCGDPTRIRQIVYNLVSNALKFTDHGSVKVHVDSKGAGFRITVEDTGIGISADRLQTLFRKFEQADASTTRKYGGTGLGLAICRELAALMGGVVTAKSEAGRGTVFVVSLPVARAAACKAPDAAPSILEASGFSPDCPLRILAAEDNPVNQLVLQTILAQAGLQVHMVGNGVQAVSAWEQGFWDLILMDVQMPEMDGPTAVRQIREREAATRRPRTPILALTANALAHQVEHYRAVGMDGFVAKPIEITRLFGAMRAALEPDTQAALRLATMSAREPNAQ